MVRHVKRGEPPLHAALFGGKIEMVRLLLKWNADVNQANNQVTFSIETVVTKDRFFETSTLFHERYSDLLSRKLSIKFVLSESVLIGLHISREKLLCTESQMHSVTQRIWN